MSRKIIIITAAIIASLIIIYFMSGEIAERRFKGKAEELRRKIPDQYREVYGKELEYAIDKFWSAYRSGIVSRNDLIDVTDYMNDLNSREDLTRKEIFDFMEHVSGIYTSEIKKKQEQEYREGAG